MEKKEQQIALIRKYFTMSFRKSFWSEERHIRNEKEFKDEWYNTFGKDKLDLTNTNNNSSIEELHRLIHEASHEIESNNIGAAQKLLYVADKITHSLIK